MSGFSPEHWRQYRQRLRWRHGLWLLASLPVLGLLYALLLIPFTPSIQDIRKAATEQPAQVLTADGQKLTEFKRSNRVWVELKDIAPTVVDALIATEDHRFREHWGLDWRRTASSALYTLRGDRQGGSTLTQQLARNLYPEEIGRAPTLTRKLKEAITALKIEAVYSKDEILETYLNTVPFLYNAYGIEMAARTYFDRSANGLDLLQSATLVGMLKGNSYYNPVLNPERALQRRNTVLAQMVKRNQLSEAKYTELKERPLRLEFERQTEPLGMAPHFAQQLRRWMINWADKHGYNLYADGLVIHTTLDMRLQMAANQAVTRQGLQLQAIADRTWQRAWHSKDPSVRELMRQTPAYQKLRGQGIDDENAIKQLQANRILMNQWREEKTRIQAGLLSVNPRNGHVLAWVGSRDYEKDAFDHVQQAKRQPGSTFKAFVYGAALLKGISPDAERLDNPVAIDVGHGEIWQPSDDSPPTGRALSLRQALAQSKNTITAQLIQEVGVNKVVQLARALGVRQSKLEAVPSLALGTSPVTLKEMVTAYASIASGGQYTEPVLVTRIENRQGDVLEDFSDQRGEKVLTEHQAWEIYDLMRGVIQYGTGRAIRSQYGIRADVAGKTGTTQDHTDGWFILMHPQVVTGAWTGFNDPRITLRNEYWGQGAHSALPMVAEVTTRAFKYKLADVQSRFQAPDDRWWLRRWWDSSWAWLKTESLSWLAPWWPEPRAPAKQPAPVRAKARAPDTVPSISSAPETAAPITESGTPDALDKKVEELMQVPDESTPTPSHNAQP